MNATRSPFGETRGCATHPVVSKSDLPDRILQAVLDPDVADDGEALPVGAPVGELDVVQDVARGAARDRDASQAARPHERVLLAAIQRDRHLAGLRDRQDLGCAEPERAATRGSRAG